MENVDIIAESSNKNGIYSKLWNVTELSRFWNCDLESCLNTKAQKDCYLNVCMFCLSLCEWVMQFRLLYILYIQVRMTLMVFSAFAVSLYEDMNTWTSFLESSLHYYFTFSFDTNSCTQKSKDSTIISPFSFEKNKGLNRNLSKLKFG